MVRIASVLAVCILACCVLEGGQAVADVKIGDAFARGTAGGVVWTIGTGAVEMTYEFRDGALTLTSFRNKLAKPAREYVSREAAASPFVVHSKYGRWTVENAAARRSTVGGRPVVELGLTLARSGIRATLHALAFPGTSVIRQWVDLENTSSESAKASAVPFAVAIRGDDATSLAHYWMHGGLPCPDFGTMRTAPVTDTYHKQLAGNATAALIPWTAFMRSGSSEDGWFLALEYIGNWELTADREASGPLNVTAQVPDLDKVELAPGQMLELPSVTICAFAGGLSDMTERSYDWQYQYMWDYTSIDYFAKPKYAVPWFHCVQNVQEQFGERLAYLDMQTDLARSMGMEGLWDDAGWALFPGWPQDTYGNVFSMGYESPDFSQTVRYLGKSGMHWTAWFVGQPSEVLDNKVGTWGNFEWRTDGVAVPDLAVERSFRGKVSRFLDNNPRCSFHTCNGGSQYAHTFGIQRLANTNYLSDIILDDNPDVSNYYFSCIEPPDRWLDITECWNLKGGYNRERARGHLTLCAWWGLSAPGEAEELVRRDVEIYHYLLREGVAGRWSYAFHPRIEGDKEHYYFQRTSRDRTKACIILRHKAPGEVTIHPIELLPDHSYVVGFDSTQETTVRTGADLMTKGVVIRDQVPGELIYLGLPDRPRGGSDKTAPTAPGSAFTRFETNIGHSGVGVYWSAGSDDNWLSYYEISRDGQVIGKAATGTYYFDHASGWDPGARYAVRTVDGDGNTSAWTEAKAIAGEALTAHALGGLFDEQGRDGWRADTTTDGKTYVPMTYLRPRKSSSADEGGTPNQPGGVEGCWQGLGGAIVARAWMQASTEAACVRSWVAPKAGKVRVTSRIMKEWYRQDKDQPLSVRVLRNDEQIWPESGWAKVPPNDLVGLTHDVRVEVAKGDAIRFVLDKGTDPKNDILAWTPRITYVESHDPGEPSVVRILCGAKKPYTDANGNVWSEDQFFTGGQAFVTKEAFASTLPTEQDQALYQSGRQGKDFSYSVPVQPGVYSVRLKLAEPVYEHIYERPFNISINGKEMLTNFDICQDARGFRKANDRVFRYVASGADGQITLRFTGGWDPAQKTDQAIVQAIEIVPEFKPVVRINCGSDADFVDWNSSVWSADSRFTGGQPIQSDKSLMQASPTPYDQALYQTARAGKSISYAIDLPPGLYSVHLKFAELWLKEPGKRPMDIEVNGRPIRKSWDPATAAGALAQAADIREDNVAPDSNGRITVRVSATGPNDAILQGIEVQ